MRNEKEMVLKADVEVEFMNLMSDREYREIARAEKYRHYKDRNTSLSSDGSIEDYGNYLMENGYGY